MGSHPRSHSCDVYPLVNYLLGMGQSPRYLRLRFLFLPVLILTSPWQAAQRMHCKYNVPVAGRYRVCTTEANLDSCFTELVFYGLPCLPLGCIIF